MAAVPRGQAAELDLPPAVAAKAKDYLARPPAEPRPRRLRFDDLVDKLLPHNAALADQISRHACLLHQNLVDNPKRRRTSDYQESLARIWERQDPAAIAIVLRRIADPTTPTLLQPDDAWAQGPAEQIARHNKKLDDHLRTRDRRWRAVLPSAHIDPLVPLLAALLDRLREDDTPAAELVGELTSRERATHAALDRAWHHALALCRWRDSTTTEATAARQALAGWSKQFVQSAPSPGLRIFIWAWWAQQITRRYGDASAAPDLLPVAQLADAARDLGFLIAARQEVRSPIYDSLLDAIAACPPSPALDAGIGALLQAGPQLVDQLDSKHTRSWQALGPTLATVDIDPARMPTRMLAWAAERGDLDHLRALLEYDDHLLLRSNSAWAILARYATADTVADLLGRYASLIERVDSFVTSDWVTPTDRQAIAARLDDADLRLHADIVWLSLPDQALPNVDQAVYERRATGGLSSAPETDRAQRVAELCVRFNNHQFSNDRRRRRCLFLLMGIGASNERLQEAIDATADFHGIPGLTISRQGPWFNRMQRWCVAEFLQRAAANVDRDALQSFFITGTGSKKSDWPGLQADIAAGIDPVATRSGWSMTQWRGIRDFGRWALKWQREEQPVNRIGTTDAGWGWLPLVILLVDGPTACAEHLETVPPKQRQQLLDRDALVADYCRLAAAEPAIGVAQLRQRLAEWLASTDLQRFLPLDGASLQTCHAAGLLDDAAYRQALRGRLEGDDASANHARLARLHATSDPETALSDWRQAIASARSASQRRDWTAERDRLLAIVQPPPTAEPASQQDELTEASASKQAHTVAQTNGSKKQKQSARPKPDDEQRTSGKAADEAKDQPFWGAAPSAEGF